MSAVPAGDPSGPTHAGPAHAGPAHDKAPAPPRALAGLRERKKQRTRTALVDAALDLFLSQGYEATTIDEIVAAVEVSQRTFFRYFATKEDVVTSFLAEHDEILKEALAERPPGERPYTALLESMRVVLRTIADGAPADSVRFRRVRKVIERTPSLMAAQMARHSASAEALAAEIARREGVDVENDLRPRIVVAFYLSSVKVAFEDCARRDIWDPGTVASRVDEALTLVARTMRDWV
ncbi:TetR family transcriptional regulator [Actinomadura sp. 7K507]|uniref:TetR family transcriptional regulator n=1 Tax=Actinomadura sp. 7K507 TaxID=2530365 RepID=UPI00104DFF2C|nr:TetR family transcriptional regulator [Actinomadura sp. 7K507]TDC86612.1 TetR family transcriptional regulator [Actinomadura sp. 7K507]